MMPPETVIIAAILKNITAQLKISMKSLPPYRKNTYICNWKHNDTYGMKHHTLWVAGVALLTLLSACQTSRYGKVVCGEVYKKDGSRLTVAQNDRLRMPSGRSQVVVTTDIYASNHEKTKIRYDSIDSVHVWHPASPDEVWTMVPVPDYGWCMRYVDNPYIQVLTFSSRGYGLFASGRMTNYYTQRIASKTKVRFLIVRRGQPVRSIGKVSGYGDRAWRERICGYVADDPELCRAIMQSKRRKYEILRLLAEYKPEQTIQ